MALTTKNSDQNNKRVNSASKKMIHFDKRVLGLEGARRLRGQQGKKKNDLSRKPGSRGKENKFPNNKSSGRQKSDSGALCPLSDEKQQK